MRFIGVIFVALFFACGPQSSPKKGAQLRPQGELAESYLDVIQVAGDATSLDARATSHAFSYPMPTLSAQELELHLEGDGAFELSFSDDELRSEFGLGPVFNNNSCVACHNKDGRGSLPLGVNSESWTKIGNNEAIFLRISIENEDTLARTPSYSNRYLAPVAVPGFSTQLFHLGAYGLRPDAPGVGQAEVWMKYKTSNFTYPDGERVELRRPIFDIRRPYDEKPSHGGQKISRIWDSDVRTSPRLAMPMYGLGLLEAIPEQDILDQLNNDFSGQGVSGRPNYVFDAEKALGGEAEALSLGRFGLKANTPSVLHQSLEALNGDVGITNSWFINESIAKTPLIEDYYSRFPYIKDIEASDEIAKAMVFYSSTLAVPPRRNIKNIDVRTGGRHFARIGCVSCHRPSFTTGFSEVAALSFQKIFPFTDLLLHDMGEGLADGRREYLASGREWKTRALWGIGLTKMVNPRASFLHDGRARTLEEAILWHGGEAEHSKQSFVRLNKKERAQLIKFLNSL